MGWARKVRFAIDSPVEGDGFELPVPQQIRSRFRASSPVSHERFDGLSTRNQRFESISLHQWAPSPCEIATLLDITNSIIETAYLHEKRGRDLESNVPEDPRQKRT